MVAKQRGDTLVEVLMSLMVLSIVIVGAVTLMARGMQSAQIALEHSETRQAVNSQIELLKYLRDQYSVNNTSANAATWASIISTSNANSTDYTGCSVTASKSGTAFYLDRSSGTVQRTIFDSSQKPPTFATAGKGLWIEADPSNAGISPAYVDFVLRACWMGSGSLGGQQQTVTAVRLYDPSR
ncbi:MAG TPA: prepilin-type N-terminal cleavage/methylation domain-containing protein [Magnetospirillaceae bacterium]|nr:prepilin-type N-terminal cleavage/methylation domain-containing protein [Magnetospirillaceae bacterium]